MNDSEFYAVATLEGIPNVTRIAIRFNGENIGHIDIFPGEGNNGVIVNEDFELEFRNACLHAGTELRKIALIDANGNNGNSN